MFNKRAIFLFVTSSGSDTVFKYASYYESNMVLQRSPQRSNIWGYAPAGDIGETVTLTVSNASYTVTSTGVVKQGIYCKLFTR